MVNVDFHAIQGVLRQGKEELAGMQIKNFKARVHMPYRGGQNIQVDFNKLLLTDRRPYSYLAEQLRYIMMPKYYSRNLKLEERREQNSVSITFLNKVDFKQFITVHLDDYSLLLIPDFLLSMLNYV